jgi:hypothetical protein
MRLRDRQRVFVRFAAGWDVIQLAWTLETKPGGFVQEARVVCVEAIIREGVNAGWNAKKVAK